jgi:HlyD family secretion protein
MKRRLILTLVLASFAASVGGYYELRPSGAPVRFETARVSRGDLVANVLCTGTLGALKTVEVGTQANGVVKELGADFNSVVHAGQVVARLDPALVQAQITQGRAAVERSKADVEQLRVTLTEANAQLARAEALHAKALMTDEDLDDSRAAAKQAAADVEGAEAQVAQAQAMAEQGELALDHTIIRSPVDGIVIARNVDVGQTVVSTMQAQTLFEIAEDLTRLQLSATVDESDIGRVRTGDPVTFTVDAYPADSFSGTVAQVRLNPNIDQAVVSYTTVVDVSNPDLKLRPGMTANVTIRVDDRHDVLRVASNALRFKPNDELFALLHQVVPARAHAGTQGEPSGVSAPARNTVPRRGGNSQRQVWVVRNGQLQAVPVQVGLSDGTYTEVAAGKLADGDQVVVNAIAR